MLSLKDFVCSKEIKKIEKKIADYFTIDIYKENFTILLNLLKKEIEQSNLQIDIIMNYFKNNIDLIYSFGINFLGQQKQKINTLSIGFSISYAIYLYYLEKYNESELIAYLNRRKIPKANNFAKELIRIYSYICDSNKNQPG